MPTTRFEYLLNCYIQNNSTEEEREELMALLQQPENEAIAQVLIDRVIENTGPEMQMSVPVASSILQNILQKDKDYVAVRNKKKIFSLWMRIAATVIFLSAGATYWVFNKKNNTREKIAVASKKISPVLPGGNRAFLTTSDGSTVILDSTQNGTITQEVTAKINKHGGVLIYEHAATKPGARIAYNTLSTPRGGQYEIVLPDGSKVWLNAASSLHFPTRFAGSERVVELTGEAYFEVAKNSQRPFRVSVGDMRINVLGTHFNINAYTDENAIKTSLLEGSVKITQGKASDVLKPGQQAVLNKNEDKVIIRNADVNEVIAWKNGLFQFEGADIATIMRQIARWYNMEIIYKGKQSGRRFEGKISRNAHLQEVLQILELSNVKFEVEDRKIIVQ